MRRLFTLLLILAAATFAPSPVSAALGFYCSSYTYTGPVSGMTCITTCVYCEDRDNNNQIVSQICYEEVCWFRREPV